MRSIRLLLFGVFPLVAISCLIGIEVRQSIVFTGDWRDLTIVGRGYFCTLDEEGNREWYRSIRLAIDRDGTLCADTNGVLRRLDPYISLPSECSRIEIRRTGEVYCMSEFDFDYDSIVLGSISTACFVNGNNSDSNQLIQPESVPVVGEPGQHGAGYLMQHAAYQSCLPLTNKVIAGCGFAMIWVALVVWAICREKQLA